jgi:DNA-binding transcriptional LysR family regulator
MHKAHNEGMSETEPPLPDAQQLLTLLAVAEAGNESAAAELLGLGQSSISRRLAALQQNTPTPLTQRTAAGTRLTPSGAALLPYAREVREALHSAARLMRPYPGVPLRVRLGISPHLLPRLAGALAGAGSSEDPLELDYLEASSSDLLSAVRGGQLDAALTLWAPAGTEPGFGALQLGFDRCVLIAPAGSDVISAGRVDPEALRRARLLLPGASSLTGRARSVARAAGLGESSLLQLPGPAAVRAAALSGQGVGVTLASYVAAEVAAAWLTAAPLAGVLEGEGPAADPQVGVWLLTNDALAPEAAQRLTLLTKDAVERSSPR